MRPALAVMVSLNAFEVMTTERHIAKSRHSGRRSASLWEVLDSRKNPTANRKNLSVCFKSKCSLNDRFWAKIERDLLMAFETQDKSRLCSRTCRISSQSFGSVWLFSSLAGEMNGESCLDDANTSRSLNVWDHWVKAWRATFPSVMAFGPRTDTCRRYSVK